LSISIDLLKHYPWLPSLQIYYSDIASKDPTAFIEEAFLKYPDGELEQRISKIFKAAFNNLEEIKDYKADELNIYLYLIVKILLYVLNNKPISNRVANTYSKQTYRELIEENEDANLYNICKDLKLRFEYLNPPIIYGINLNKSQREILKTSFKIHFTDYLKLAANLHDDYRKLVHNALSEGYVYVQKKDLIRLLQEYVRRKLIVEEVKDENNIEKFRKNLLKIREFKELYGNILNNWELKKEDFEYSFKISFKEGSDISNNFPPCIQDILHRIQEGMNIVHTERLFLVFFLHALNYPIENIIDIFSNLPDFDRKKTRYQVEFAKKKEYTPHSCSTLKSLNICKASESKDELCLEGYYSKKLDKQNKLSHPLFYIQLKQYRNSNKNKANKPKIEKENE
jgi:DNA primase large subunit